MREKKINRLEKQSAMGNCNCTALGGGPRGDAFGTAGHLPIEIALTVEFAFSGVTFFRQCLTTIGTADTIGMPKTIEHFVDPLILNWFTASSAGRERHLKRREEKKMCKINQKPVCEREERRESRSKAAQSFLVVANETMIDEESQFCFLRKSEDFNPTLIFK